MKLSDLSKIFHHFGAMTQILKLMEELAELLRALTIAISRYELDSEKILADEDVQSEMADVVILLKQFGLLPELNIDLGREAEKKIKRTLDRIEEGYYDQS